MESGEAEGPALIDGVTWRGETDYLVDFLSSAAANMRELSRLLASLLGRRARKSVHLWCRAGVPQTIAAVSDSDSGTARRRPVVYLSEA